MKTIFGTLLVSGAVALAIGLSVVYSGVYNVSALVPHNESSTWLMKTTMHASVERRAGEVVVPELTPAMQQAGINDFESMCASCHDRPGKKTDAMGLGLNPRAPDLAKSGAHLTPAELYWITKNGIKMTGMPAWGATHGDADLWPVVAFMTELPNLDKASYGASLASASGAGHHAPQEVSGHQEEPLEHLEETVEEKPAHDHSSHDH